MSGPAPKQQRRRRNAPASGEWKASPGLGWQHGAVPEPPDGLLAVSRDAWTAWMRSWWAAHWLPNDLPGLHLVIVQYDAVKRVATAKANDLTALVRLMDTYGITPAGQQARHWAAPMPEDKAVDAHADETAPADPYRRLRAVS